MTTADGAASGAVTVERYRAEHLPALTAFYRDIWDAAATEASVGAARARDAARNVVSPGEEPPTFLVLERGRVLGHLGTIPVQLDTPNGRRGAHWLIGFMVRPEHRNGPIGFLLLREATRQVEVLLSLTVADASVRLFKATGFTHVGTVPNAIKLLRPGRVLRRVDLAAVGLGGMPRPLQALAAMAQWPGIAALGGAAIAAGLGVLTQLRRGQRGAGTITAGLPDAATLDALWGRVSGSLGHAAVRDGAYLAPRYPHGSSDVYQCVQLQRDGVLRGVAVVRRPRAEGDARLRGIRVATLSDLIADPGEPDDVLALLAAAEGAARAGGADALLASPSTATLGALLARRAWLPFRGNLQYLVRDATGALPGGTTLPDWWLSRGDMNADAVF